MSNNGDPREKKRHSPTTDGANSTRMQLNDTECKTALAEKEISVVEKVELPVYEEDLLPEKSIRCVQICKRMLSRSTVCYATHVCSCWWT